MFVRCPQTLQTAHISPSQAVFTLHNVHCQSNVTLHTFNQSFLVGPKARWCPNDVLAIGLIKLKRNEGPEKPIRHPEGIVVLF